MNVSYRTATAPSYENSIRAAQNEKRARSKAEADQCRTLEALLNLHRLDFWHCTVSQRSQPGWPDYVVFGDGWLAFFEIKARSTNTGKMGKVSTHQERYKASIEAAGAEWRVFKLPDEWHGVDQFLNDRTHKGIWGSWR